MLITAAHCRQDEQVCGEEKEGRVTRGARCHQAPRHADIRGSVQDARLASPIFRAFYDRKHVARQLYAPEPLPELKAGLTHAHLAENSGQVKTFTPPASLLSDDGHKHPVRVLRYLVMAVWLMRRSLAYGARHRSVRYGRLEEDPWR